MKITVIPRKRKKKVRVKLKLILVSSSNISKGIIEPFSNFYIPLSWLIETHIVLASLIVNGKPESSHKILIPELNYIFNFSSEKEIKQDKDEGGQEQKKLTDENLMQSISLDDILSKYSKLVEFESEGKNLHFSIDLLALKPLKLDDKESSLFYYYIVINPSVVMENLVPYKIFYQINNEEITSSIRPTQVTPLFNIDYYNKNEKFQINMGYANGIELVSDDFVFTEDHDEEEVKPIKLYDKNNTFKKSDFITINFYFIDIDIVSIYNTNYLRKYKFFSKSKKIQIYADYLVVNRMDRRLFLENPNNIKGKEEELSLNFENSLNSTVFEGQVNIFYLPKNVTKGVLRTESSTWSKPSEFYTTGMDGTIPLTAYKQTNKNQKHPEKYVTDVAIIITSSSVFSWSNVIILEPRFLLSNKLGFDIKFRQNIFKEDNSDEIQVLSNGSSKVLTFDMGKSGKGANKKLLQFTMDHYSESGKISSLFITF